MALSRVRVERIARANKGKTLEKKDEQGPARELFSARELFPTRELFPGIPDYISVNVIAAKFLGWKDICILSSVSHGWCQAVRNREVYNERVRSQSTQRLYLEWRIGYFRYEVSLSPPGFLYCYRLPVIEGLYRMSLFASRLVALDGKVYALGGDIKRKNDSPQYSNEMYVLDIARKKQWKPCASMNQARGCFRVGVVDGKIYVSGGLQYVQANNSDTNQGLGSEMYDPPKNTWTRIKETPNKTCFRERSIYSSPYIVGELFV